ncbi:Quinonprotein alcohol dehydrogenase-like superfamily [Phytophthora cinnamomi]|uniref:Quinonprotein alcohol dehydrogenase-like superfamily n=1 Tax=Phytophthora cinnamomi TaxID=4785 RepID=UPI0035596F0F|nr:Quinonprotein alcohol dehydrogenase-like superfamily [Phytophthora cinnamomi]
MDNAAELTCAQGCRASRVYVGAADGSVLAIAANGAGELPPTHGRWGRRVCAQAVTSVCGVEAGEEGALLLLVGSAGGELVVLREELEVRRFQLESAVQQICYDRDGEFVVGDALGNLYAVTQYEVLWKRRLPAFAPRDGVNADCFYPSLAQPTVRAIAHAKLLDVEKTLSNYVLVATGQKHLLVTHRGKDFGVIPTRTPIATLASFSVGDEDVVLAAGEEGVIYRLVSCRDTVPKDMPDFGFAVEVWTQLSFSVAKLLPVKHSADSKPSEFAWICLGTDGEVALFRGQDHVKQWDAASFSTTHDADRGFPVDLTMIYGNDTDAMGAIVFTDRIRVFPIELTDQ